MWNYFDGRLRDLETNFFSQTEWNDIIRYKCDFGLQSVSTRNKCDADGGDVSRDVCANVRASSAVKTVHYQSRLMIKSIFSDTSVIHLCFIKDGLSGTYEGRNHPFTESGVWVFESQTRRGESQTTRRRAWVKHSVVVCQNLASCLARLHSWTSQVMREMPKHAVSVGSSILKYTNICQTRPKCIHFFDVSIAI